MVYFFGKQKNSKVPEGVQHFTGWGEGSNFFPGGGGVQMLISVETY